jgi:hypothetical protein
MTREVVATIAISGRFDGIVIEVSSVLLEVHPPKSP